MIVIMMTLMTILLVMMMAMTMTTTTRLYHCFSPKSSRPAQLFGVAATPH